MDFNPCYFHTFEEFTRAIILECNQINISIEVSIINRFHSKYIVFSFQIVFHTPTRYKYSTYNKIEFIITCRCAFLATSIRDLANPYLYQNTIFQSIQ